MARGRGDRGVQYSPAIYYETEEEKRVAEEVAAEIEKAGKFEKPLAVPMLPRQKFWPAEDYYQDYAARNSIRYKLYRTASGRDAFIKNTGEIDFFGGIRHYLGQR